MHAHSSSLSADLPLRHRAARVSRFVHQYPSTKDAAQAIGIPIYVLQYHIFVLRKLDEDLSRTEAAIARLERGPSPIPRGSGTQSGRAADERVVEETDSAGGGGR